PRLARGRHPAAPRARGSTTARSSCGPASAPRSRADARRTRPRSGTPAARTNVRGAPPVPLRSGTKAGASTTTHASSGGAYTSRAAGFKATTMRKGGEDLWTDDEGGRFRAAVHFGGIHHFSHGGGPMRSEERRVGQERRP